MKRHLALLLLALCACNHSNPPPKPGTLPPIKTVFLIVFENHNWSDIQGNPSAPYLNQTLLPQASYALDYFNPPGLHPSEPNYLWLEAGDNFGVRSDSDPATNHQSSTAHLVNQLEAKNLGWKSYQENIDGKSCPLATSGLYAPKHNPFVFFDDVTDTNNPSAARCLAHVRPFAELDTDLASGKVAAYNFLTPNLCDDMHNTTGCASGDSVANGDTWLSQELPKLLASDAYKNGGAIFITWDEGEHLSDGPIGMIVLSPYAKGGGYQSSVHFTHSSMLRTVQELFGLTPLLGDAANANDLADVFKPVP